MCGGDNGPKKFARRVGRRFERGFDLADRECRVGAIRSPAKPVRPVRLLCALAVLVAVLLRSVRRARSRVARTMRSATLLLCGARLVAAIRARLSGVLST